MRPFAFPVLLALLAAPSLLRAGPGGSGGPCAPAGMGRPPRHWLGCAADGGPRRGLSGEERLLLGLPLDPNLASASALSHVPGLSPSLAAGIVREREEGGPFRSPGELLRVRGIGPRRLARAVPFLEVGARGLGVAEAAE